MRFHIGQKVVATCGKWKAYCGELIPQKGEVYTIRGIEHCDTQDMTGLLLEEITNAPRAYKQRNTEIKFSTNGFRPVTEKKTSIEIFQRMLLPQQQGVDA